jgi:hypothetical protein
MSIVEEVETAGRGFVMARDAAILLGVPKKTITYALKAGLLPFSPNPFDRRQKVVPLAAE